MTRLVTSGGELADTGASATTNNPDGLLHGSTFPPTTTQPRSGAYSFVGGTQSGMYFGSPSITSDAGSLGILLDVLNSPHRFRAYVATSAVYSSPSAIPDSTWYRVEMSFTLDASSNISAYEFLIDGTSVASGSPTPFAPTTANLIGIARSTSNYRSWDITTVASRTYYTRVYIEAVSGVIYIDDFAINDDQGSAQNSWPDSGKVVLLRPVSDNAAGANWTEGAGGTGALWDAVDNEPPVGVALASATDTSQIKNVAKDTTGNYDANLGAYSTAVSSGGGGMVTGDTVSVVQAVWNIGEDSTSSGGVTLGMLLVSNPQANGGTETTDTPGVVAATYPVRWKWEVPATQSVYSPSVTLATSPVIRVGKRTSATRAAMCDFMGLYVDYVPGASGQTYTKAGYGKEHGT